MRTVVAITLGIALFGITALTGGCGGDDTPKHGERAGRRLQGADRPGEKGHVRTSCGIALCPRASTSSDASRTFSSDSKSKRSRTSGGGGVADVVSLKRRDDPGFTVRPSDARHLGYLIVDGLLSCRIRVEDREAVELLGPGDFIRPWVRLEALSIPAEARWKTEAGSRIAVLGPNFAERLGAWPQVASNLMDRLTERARWLTIDLAVASARRVDSRLVLTFWYFADHWGRRTRDGVVIPLKLTHEILAEVIGSRRPSVSTGLGKLADQGVLLRRDYGWLLTGEPPPSVESLERQFELDAPV